MKGLTFCSFFLVFSSVLLADIEVDKKFSSCTADWACVGDLFRKGEVKARVGSDSASCRKELVARASSSGLCTAYELRNFTVSDSVEKKIMITCADGYGATVCTEFDALIENLSWNCTGSACDSLWAKRVEYMQAVVRAWNRTFRAEHVISREVADKAYTVADRACNKHYTGDVSQLEALIDNTNSVVDVLSKFQYYGGIVSYRTCHFGWK